MPCPREPLCSARIVTGNSLGSRAGAAGLRNEQRIPRRVSRGEDELDSLRIREARSLRRNLVRTRAYLVIGSIVAVGLIIKLVQTAIDTVYFEHNGWTWAAGLEVAFAALGVGLIIYMLIVAQRLKRELDKPTLEDPLTPPDFSTLSDGSERKAQQAHDLEQPVSGPSRAPGRVAQKIREPPHARRLPSGRTLLFTRDLSGHESAADFASFVLVNFDCRTLDDKSKSHAKAETGVLDLLTRMTGRSSNAMCHRCAIERVVCVPSWPVGMAHQQCRRCLSGCPLIFRGFGYYGLASQ